MKNIETQQQLVSFGLLDPPADGKWGAQSQAALEDFERLYGCPIGQANQKPQIKLGNDFVSKIISSMINHGYFLSRGPARYNIVYVEGVDSSGKTNADRLNEWNDRRIVIEIPDLINPKVVGNWLATTEPGATYTYKPMNRSGAFRIAFGQYKAWRVGTHGRTNYPALVQCGSVCGFRDFNKDGIRTGDQHVTGAGFGINQHHGWDMKFIEEGSAGCLVGQSVKAHEEFMAILKRDRRYRVNPSYVFFTTILAGDKL